MKNKQLSKSWVRLQTHSPTYHHSAILKGVGEAIILNYLNPLYQEAIAKEALERVTKLRSQRLFPEVRDPFMLS